uniref:Uncharacterized protein n=1 Tax=Anguilla anguilla TaxID=7936 RepID=A0A0E9V4R0_ANGAN
MKLYSVIVVSDEALACQLCQTLSLLLLSEMKDWHGNAVQGLLQYCCQ